MSAKAVLDAALIAKADALGVHPNHVNVEWQDVTAQFTQTSASLAKGEIIASPGFSLHDAMSAIELLDPKMDIGMSTEHIHTLNEIEALDMLIPASSLSLANIIHLMDKLIVAEMMHYQGHHLAQCLLSCYYIQDIERLLKASPLLLNFCSILMRRCYYIRESFDKAKCYYDEDWIEYNFGFSIGQEFDDEKLLASFSKLLASETASLDKTTSEEEKTLKQAIMARLRWNKALWAAHVKFDLPRNEGLAEAGALLKEAQSYMESILNTSSLAIDPEDAYKTTTSENASTSSAVKKIFEPEITRRLVTTTPPRFVPWIGLKAMLDAWNAIIAKLLELITLPNTIKSLRDAKMVLSDLVSENKGLIVSSRFLNIVLSTERSFLGKSSLDLLLLSECLNQFGISSLYVKTDMMAVAHHMQSCEAGLYELFRALASSRARTRRRLPHVFELWQRLLVEGDMLDNKLGLVLNLTSEEERNARSFTRFHLDMILQMISDFLLAGFELDLYERYEYPMIWWYLDNISASRFKGHQRILEALPSFNKRASDQTDPSNKNATSAKKTDSAKKGPNNQNQKTPSASPPSPNWYSLELNAKFELTRGIFLFTAALDAAGYLAVPSNYLGNARTLFFSRFHPLLNLNQPTPLRFEQFQLTYLDVLHKRSTADLLELAKKSLQNSMKLFQELINFSQPADTATSSDQSSTPITPPTMVTAEAQKLLKLALSNAMQVTMASKSNILATRSPSPPTHRATFDFSQHRQYPVISIKPVEQKK